MYPQAFDVASEITRCSSPVLGFLRRGPGLASEQRDSAAGTLTKWAAAYLRVTRALRAMESPQFASASRRLFLGGGAGQGASLTVKLKAAAEFLPAAIELTSSDEVGLCVCIVQVIGAITSFVDRCARMRQSF